MATGTLFPEIAPESIRKISVPALLLSYPFLGLIDERLSQLLPIGQRVIFPDTGRQMWLAGRDLCRSAAMPFLQRNGIG